MNVNDCIEQVGDISNSTELLYYYTSMKTAIKTMEKGTLRFSALRDMDDPYETTYFATTFGPEKADSGLKQMMDFFNYRQNVRIKSFCVDSNISPDEVSTYPFNKGYTKSRMWSQYADKHTGACFVFNKLLLKERLSAFIGEKARISYSTEMLYKNNISEDIKKCIEELDYSEIHEFFQKNEQLLLFRKNEDYEDEAEYRIGIVGYPSDQECDLPYENALVSVILGSNYCRSKDKKLKKIACTRKIHLLNLFWFHGSPDLSFMNSLQP